MLLKVPTPIFFARFLCSCCKRRWSQWCAWFSANLLKKPALSPFGRARVDVHRNASDRYDLLADRLSFYRRRMCVRCLPFLWIRHPNLPQNERLKDEFPTAFTGNRVLCQMTLWSAFSAILVKKKLEHFLYDREIIHWLRLDVGRCSTSFFFWEIWIPNVLVIIESDDAGFPFS